MPLDPIYGDPPIDYGARWDQLLLPPLVNDAEMQVWRTVLVGALGELADSNHLTRFRLAVSTASGVHLDGLGADLQFPRPTGWLDARYQPVLEAIDGAVFGTRRPSVTAALADSLVDGTQAWEMQQGDPLTYVVVFYELPTAEAQTYRTVLEYGRPKGVRFALVYSPDAKADVFVLDASLLDGPDKLALLI